MQVLVVYAHPSSESYSRALLDAACRGLGEGKHHYDVIDLYAEGFQAAMSRAERLAYESDTPIVDPMVATHARLVAAAQVLVFVYPTWWWGMPAILKGWLERVMVPGVAFRLDPRTNRVRPGLKRMRRLVGITTYGSSRAYMRIFNDAGRRVVTRCLRLSAPALRCRSHWHGLYNIERSTAAQREAFVAKIEKAMSTL